MITLRQRRLVVFRLATLKPHGLPEPPGARRIPFRAAVVGPTATTERRGALDMTADTPTARMSEPTIIVRTYWQVEIVELDGKAYPIGGEHDELDSAKWYLEKCLLLRVGKRGGYPRKTRFNIVRYELTKRSEL